MPAAQPTDLGQPSVTGLDRGHWPITETRPADGRTFHHPHYWEDRAVCATSGVVPENTSFEGMLIGSLDHAEAEGWSRENTLNAFVQPIEFGMDAVMVPVRVFRQPPNEYISTP